MMEQDIFVGIVATGLGFFVLGSAILNTPGFSRFWFCRRVENAFGPDVARGIGGLIGLLVVLLGVLLMLGLLPAKKARSSWLSDHSGPSCGSQPVIEASRHG